MSRPQPMVAIFWDYENCHPPSSASGYCIANQIRYVAQRFGSVNLFKAYFDFSQCNSAKSLSLRSELQTSGVSLTDCPHNGKKDVADNMILVDMLSYAMDNLPPATIILITGDRDFAYAVSLLRLRQYRVVIIAPAVPLPHISLRSQASILLSWNTDVLGQTDQNSKKPIPTHSKSVSLPELSILHAAPVSSSGLHRLSSPSQDSSVVKTSTKGVGMLGETEVDGTSRRFITANECFPTQLPKLSDTGIFGLSGPEDWVSVMQEDPCRDLSPEDSSMSSYLHDNDWTEIRPEAEGVASLIEGDSSSTSSTSVVDWTSFEDDEFIDGEILAIPEPPKRPESSPNGGHASISSSILFTPPRISARHLPTASESGIQLVGRNTSSYIDEEEATTSSLEVTNDVVVAGPDRDTSESDSIAKQLLSSNDEFVQSGTNDLTQIPAVETAPDHTPLHPITTEALQPITTALNSVPCSPHSSSKNPMKATSPPPAQQTFWPLVDILRGAHKRGISLPTRSSVASLLLKRDPTVYQRSGLTSFGTYAAHAQSVGLVKLGVTPSGDPWIALQSEFRTQTPPAKFSTLVDILNEEHSGGKMFPSRSAVVASLQKRAPKAIQQAGVKTYRQYFVVAEGAGIVHRGHTKGIEAWISLQPRWWKNAK